jgi:hypothetical protein
VEEVGLKAALTPLGRPDAANATLPVKGLTSATVIVSVPLAPCAIDREVTDGVRVKLPVPVEVTVSMKVAVDAARVPEVPVTEIA